MKNPEKLGFHCIQSSFLFHLSPYQQNLLSPLNFISCKLVNFSDGLLGNSTAFSNLPNTFFLIWNINYHSRRIIHDFLIVRLRLQMTDRRMIFDFFHKNFKTKYTFNFYTAFIQNNRTALFRHGINSALTFS